jgi:tRNA modification GTPase
MKTLVICNKMDKNPYFRPQWLTNLGDETIPDFYFSIANPQSSILISPISEEQIITLSAKEGMNIPYLKDALLNLVTEGKVNQESTIVSNARHYEALQKSYQSLDDVLKGMASSVTSDFIAMDIRQALHYLGEIVGEVSTDDLLENIFSKFCIGK